MYIVYFRKYYIYIVERACCSYGVNKPYNDGTSRTFIEIDNDGPPEWLMDCEGIETLILMKIHMKLVIGLFLFLVLILNLDLVHKIVMMKL